MRKASSRSRSAEDDDLLRGWREIASYLQCSPKSAHRWEAKDELPILRPDKSRKGIVFASKRALNAWLTHGIESAMLTDNRLIVFDRKTRILWAHEFSAPIRNYATGELEWRLRF